MREMKDSGVAWIGEIPKDWDLSRLKFSSTYNDESIKEDTNPEKEIEYVEIGSVTLENGVEKAEVMRFKDAPSRARRIARKGDIIISTVRTYLKAIALIEKESYTVSTGFCVIRPQKCMDSGYLKYFCSSELFTSEVSACSVGISYPAINASTLMDFHIINPPLAVQHKIVRVLDEKCNHVDSLIANVQAQIEKLKAYKQSLITEVVTKGLDLNAPMKDSGVDWIGTIPENWNVVKTGRLFRENNRCPIGNDVPLSLSQADGLVATADMKESSLETSSYDNWKRVEIGDLVLNRFKAHLGVLFAAKLTGIVSFHYGVYEAQCRLVPKFYEYLYHSNQYKAILGNASNGMVVGLQNLSNLSFYTTYSLYPPYAEQEKIADYLDAKCSQIDQLISLKESKIEKLQQYKRSLIYEYVTGKKEVV